jgi:hypothetical protein
LEVAKKRQGSAPFKLIFVDLDDPNMLLGKFMMKLKQMNSKSDVYAVTSNCSYKLVKSCQEVNVTLLEKPMTAEKL